MSTAVVSLAIARDKPGDVAGQTPAIMADVAEVEVVVAHHERATLRVGDVFLKIDADQTRTDVEVEAMAIAPIPTPEILWRKLPVLALAAPPRDGIRSPRRAVDRVVGGVGCGTDTDE